MVLVMSFSVSMFCLFGAVLVYGLFGSPTPDNPGLTETFLAVCLLVAVGWRGLLNLVDIKSKSTAFLKYLQLLFIVGLVVPTLSALFWDNDHHLMLRDILAFLFLGLPLFFKDRLNEARVQKYLPFVVMLAGFLFCLRTLIPVFNIWIEQGELLYLSNSPMAIMTSVFLVLSVWRALEDFHPASLVKTFAMMVALGVILAAMLLDVQRATIGAVFISLCALAAIDFWQNPKRAFVPLCVMTALLAFIAPWVLQAFSEMAAKTASVGLNARLAEAYAVYDVISSDALTYLFGRGWGAVFSSPAVAGLDVNYTHSFITTMMLKGGMVLCVATLAMALAALHQIFLIFQRDKVEGITLFWPFMVPVFLYASHKSLDFGLILLIISVWADKARDGQSSPVALENITSDNTKR